MAGSATVFVYDVKGDLVAEYGGTVANGGVSYITTDQLGSTRVVTAGAGPSVTAGTVLARYDYQPFGDYIPGTTQGRQNFAEYATPDDARQKFTSKERDNESDLDYFLARYYSSAQGRFTGPDQAASAQEIDPQTWNLYAYVADNPLTRVDPDGRNWFYIGGQYQWHDGNTYTYKDKNGAQHKLTSNYTHLLVILKTGKKNKDGAEIVKFLLYGRGENDLIARGKGFTGGKGNESTPSGTYVINLNNRGGPETNRFLVEGGYPQMAPWHNGIQEIAKEVEPGSGVSFGWEWGSKRANLAHENGQGTSYYMHGKWLSREDMTEYEGERKYWTHGCSCEPQERVLDALFGLNPSQVGEGPKKGIVVVWVASKPKQ